jgi:class 3 adenylate cyclase
MEHVHRRFMAYFVEQDVDRPHGDDPAGEALELGRVRVAIAFADLAGYTRLTEEVGEEEASGRSSGSWSSSSSRCPRTRASSRRSATR